MTCYPNDLRMSSCSIGRYVVCSSVLASSVGGRGWGRGREEREEGAGPEEGREGGSDIIKFGLVIKTVSPTR